MAVGYPKLISQNPYQPPLSLLTFLVEYKRSHLPIEHGCFEQALIIGERNNDVDHVAYVKQCHQFITDYLPPNGAYAFYPLLTKANHPQVTLCLLLQAQSAGLEQLHLHL